MKNNTVLKKFFIPIRLNDKEYMIINPAIMLFFLSLAVLVWKIPYGWGAYDEPFYIATPYRFVISNDAFFSDEWNLAQLSSFILLVPVRLYKIFFPDMEGVILSFRILYTTVHIFFSGVTAFLLKEKRTAGIIAAVFYMLFIPFNIMNFSYDAMGLESITFLALLIYTKKEPGKKVLFLIGMLFAFAVLCNPYLVILFVAYIFTLILYIKRKMVIRYLNMHDMLWIFLGILLPAVIFLLFLFSRTNISEIMQNLPFIFNDPTHGKVSLAGKLESTLKEMNRLYSPWIYFWVVLVLCQIIDKERYRRKAVYTLFASMIFVLTVFRFAISVVVNCYMLPFALFGINIYLISEKQNRRTLFLWFAGLIYGIFMWIASDQGIYIVSMAMLISVIASMLMIWDTYQEAGDERLKLFYIFVFVVQIMMEIIGLSRSTHWESVRTEQLDTVYERGPLKGLRSTKDKVDIYYLLLDDIEEYKDDSGERVAFLTLNTWEDLYIGRPYGTFSAWLGYTDVFVADKFLGWCKLHPDKMPKDIYFSKLEEAQWSEDDIDRIADKLEYEIIESEISYKLLKQ